MRELPPTYSHSVITFSRHSSNENKSVQLNICLCFLFCLYLIVLFLFPTAKIQIFLILFYFFHFCIFCGQQIVGGSFSRDDAVAYLLFNLLTCHLRGFSAALRHLFVLFHRLGVAVAGNLGGGGFRQCVQG